MDIHKKIRELQAIADRYVVKTSEDISARDVIKKTYPHSPLVQEIKQVEKN